MPAKIVIVGSYNTDLTTYMAELPAPGETVFGHRFVVGPGGKGSNQAVAAARLGAEITFVGRIGTDAYAQYALELWARENIDTSHIQQDPDQPTGVAPIFVDDEGENMIAVALGANLKLTPAHVDAVEAIIAQADVLITQFEIPEETALHALAVARRHGVRTILNPAPARVLSQEQLALADVLTPNESELEILIQRHGTSFERDAEELLVNEAQAVVLTMGAWGSVWVRQSGHGRVEPYDVEVVDSTGAGDSFNAALAVALAEGSELPEAVQFANAAAALCVGKPGTAASMPRRAEVDALFGRR